jgi:hypothetical protein
VQIYSFGEKIRASLFYNVPSCLLKYLVTKWRVVINWTDSVTVYRITYFRIPLQQNYEQNFVINFQNFGVYSSWNTWFEYSTWMCKLNLSSFSSLSIYVVLRIQNERKCVTKGNRWCRARWLPIGTGIYSRRKVGHWGTLLFPCPVWLCICLHCADADF